MIIIFFLLLMVKKNNRITGIHISPAFPVVLFFIVDFVFYSAISTSRT